MPELAKISQDSIGRSTTSSSLPKENQGLLSMNRYHVIALIALFILVVALPVYALREPQRMEQAQTDWQQELVGYAASIYVEHCSLCHGVAGEGIGAMPALNNPGLAQANRRLLYRTIAHSPHGTPMAAWHLDEGGVLMNSYQVEGLVALIQHADWPQVGEIATARGLAPAAPIPVVEMASLEIMAEPDPHECRACHEEPLVHAGLFGLNCARCHTLQTWKPAFLSRHVFLLDHGGQGQVACQTCHTQTYAAHTCYECHDHQPEQMREVHAREDIVAIENCVECHPTGRAGEAGELRDLNTGQEHAGEPYDKPQATQQIAREQDENEDWVK